MKLSRYLRLLRGALLSGAALFCVIKSTATPILEVSLVQNGDDCSLTWSVEGVTAEHWGVVLYININGQYPYPNSVMGWWPSPEAIVMNGTVSEGWTDVKANPVSADNLYYFWYGGRQAQVFTLGIHQISAVLFEGEGNHPGAFAPDSTWGGIISQTLVSSFTVVDPADASGELSSEEESARVPDSGGVSLLLAVSLGGLFFRAKIAWKKY